MINKMIFNLQRQHLRKFLLVAIALFVGMIARQILFPRKADAAIWPPGNLYMWTMPNANYNNLYHCNEPAWNPAGLSPAFTDWVSIANQPTVTTITVPYGRTTPINLDYNLSGATCYQSGGSVISANTAVTTIDTAGIARLNGDQIRLDLGAGSPVGTYANSRTRFTYVPPGGFTSSGLHRIAFRIKRINQFPASPNFRCVGGTSRSTTSLTAFGPCDETPVEFWINVTVTNAQQDVRMTTTGSCTTVSGWAIDQDYPDGKVRVVLTQGASYSAGGTIIPPGIHNANDTNPTINPPYPWRGFPASQRNGHGFNVDITGRVPPGSSRTFYVATWGFDSARNPDSIFAPRESGPITVTCPAPPPLVCQTIAFTPSTIEAGVPFRFNLTLRNNGTIAQTGTLTINIRDSANANVVPTITQANFTVNANATATYASPSVTVANPINFFFNVVHNGRTATGTGCDGTAGPPTGTAQNLPYVRFYGADVIAGVRSCPAWSATDLNANVRGFRGYSDPNVPTFDAAKGSASQLAINALGTIDNSNASGRTGFSSAVLRAGNPGPATGLGFANAPSGTYGSFNANRCIPDYYGAPSGFGNPNPTLDANSNGSYYRNGTLQLSTQTISEGKRLTIYVNGDVRIVGNLTYSDPTNWTSANDIPSVTIITNNDIFIDSGVTQIDASLIAQDPTRGTIYTCTSGPSQVADSSKFTTCNRPLTINGSLVARAIRWQRTYGSTRDAATGETPRSGARVCSNPQAGVTSPTCAAEVVNYGPEVYAVPGNTGLDYDYVSSLPPIL